MGRPAKKTKKIEGFGFSPGHLLARKYEVIEQIGDGWEGEVYLLRELATGIERAAKFFYPHRNPHNRNLKFYAKKLHKLRHCPIVVQYLTQEQIRFRGMPISFLVSEFIEGELFSDYLNKQRGKRLTPFQGLHLLHSLTSGIEHIHNLGEYHGDLHTDNIMVRHYGLGYKLKLFDMFHWRATKAENIRDDVCDMIRLFYESIGGRKCYASQSPEIKGIICGLKRSLILKKFRTAGHLRKYLETIEWE